MMTIRKTLTFLMLAIGLAFAIPIWAQQNPCFTASNRAQKPCFTQEQVSNMVRSGLGDKSGLKLIE
jgi:hypothetical protein